MVLKDFFPVFLVSLIFFVMILQLLDLFSNLWKYLNNDVPLSLMLRISLLYLPKCVSFVLPVTILFSVSYILGQYFQNNELIAILNSGISLGQFVRPFLFIGLLFSLFSFFFEDRMVIPSYRLKKELSDQASGIVLSLNNSQVTLISGEERFVYHAEFYNDQQQSLSRPLLIERDKEGLLLRRIDGDSATWNGTNWEFRNARIYSDFNSSRPRLEQKNRFSDPRMNEPPESFRRREGDIAQMTLDESRIWIRSLRKAGLPYRKELTDYYSKFSFPLTSLIVTLISCALGSRFRKNILLMSLLVSLGMAVLYYILQMILSLMSTYGYLPPLTGAWLGFILFLALGIFMFSRARS